MGVGWLASLGRGGAERMVGAEVIRGRGEGGEGEGGGFIGHLKINL